MSGLLSTIVFIAFLICGSFVLFLIVIIANTEVEEKQRNKENAFYSWCEQIREEYGNIYSFYKQCNENGTIISDNGDVYDSIKKIGREIKTYEEDYRKEYDKQLINHQVWLQERTMDVVNNIGAFYVISSLNALILLKSFGGDSVFDTAIKALQSMLKENVKITNYITEEEYGRMKLLILEEDIRKCLEEKLPDLESKIVFLQKNTNQLNNKNLCAQISLLNGEFLKEVSSLMWYYAIQKPFDAIKYSNAENAFNKYTVRYYNNELVPKVEYILANVYAKNQIGGMGTVRPEIPSIMRWLEIEILWGETDECCALASGLAWMDLYELERDVLRKLVAAGMQLPEEVQERLSFLESGGASDVKIYSDVPTDKFAFDSTATEWKINDFDVFFRKIAMKKMKLNYSLAVDKWTKTLPLASGQKVDSEKMYTEFESMIEDFDGEVTCEKVMAQAINLENVEYEDAILFRFNSKRNKCVSMLFSSEKYGKNLNITIITLFTPEEGIEYEELKKYALAINENMYVDSFKESILQSVDTVLQVKKTVYDEQEVKKNIFE